jgi:Tol biopolymer transport system component
VPLTAYPGGERYVTFSPDGSQVAFGWNAADTQPDIYVQVTGSTANPLRLTNDVHTEEAMAWSPDGRRIAFSRLYTRDGPRRRKAFVVSPLGGPEKEIADLAGAGVAAISWLQGSILHGAPPGKTSSLL